MVDAKDIVSALLGFSAVILLNQPQAAMLSRSGNKYVPLFVIVLVSQILMEILFKYKGKACETIEGLFTAMIAVAGYLVGMMIIERQTGFGSYTSSSYGTSSARYGTGSSGSSGYGYGSVGQRGGAVTLELGQTLLVGGIVALFLFIWKRWLKPWILPMTCDPCKRQVRFSLQSPIEVEDTEADTQQQPAAILAPPPPAATQQPVQQPQQPMVEQYNDFYFPSDNRMNSYDSYGNYYQ